MTEALNTVDGIYLILWLCVRGLNEITQDELGALLTMDEVPAMAEFVMTVLAGQKQDDGQGNALEAKA